MKLKAVIFDMDGTIMDSMPFWGSVGALYLRSLGVEPEDDLGEKFFSMTLEEAEVYLKNEYRLDESPEEIGRGIKDQARVFYEGRVEMKPGMKEFLKELKDRNIKTAIATVTDKPFVISALKRTEAIDLFNGVITTKEVGVGKRHPDVFLKALDFTETAPGETLVVEDAIHSIRTASAAGFVTAGVYDQASENEQDEIKKAADYYLDEELEYGKLLELF